MFSEELQDAEINSTPSNSSMSTPLLHSNSKSASQINLRGSLHSKINNDQAKKDGFRKRTVSVGHADNLDLTGKKLVSPHILSYSREKALYSEGCSQDDMQGRNKRYSDIAAMSVLSVYQNEVDLEAEMNTDGDIADLSASSTQVSINEKQQVKATEKLNFCPCNISSPEDVTNVDIPEDLVNFKCPKPTIYFDDGKRSVDFVLVWDAFKQEAVSKQSIERRKTFEENLKKEGLELEYAPAEINGLNFVKVHAPQEVLRRYSEILKLRMPMKEELFTASQGIRNNILKNAASFLSKKMRNMNKSQSRTNYIMESLKAQWEKVSALIAVDKEMFPEKKHRFTAIYSRDREYLFDVESSCFFTPAIHSRIVQFIFDRKRFSENADDDFAFGIDRLLNEKVYSATYPLHDGDMHQPGSMRLLLYKEWATVAKWYRHQPLDYVKEYFGVKIALYFAWLGFYTSMLIPAALVGLTCFLYSVITMESNIPTQDTCDNKMRIIMCPSCDDWCTYWDLSETCIQAKVTYLVDNGTTVFFAIFMSFWATLFLELWKRYSAEITHRWDLTGFDVQEEHPRPEYLARLAHVKKKQVNFVTNTMEPQVPFWRMRVPATIFSFSVVLLMVALAMASVLAVVLYRMSVLAALTVHGDKLTTSYATIFTTVTAASINLVCIVIFNWLYTWIAEYLTEVELLRTQTQFDDSLTLKIYLLQFVNYYASIFYIAFFKGKLVGSPGDYNSLFGYRLEECGPGGCLMELCIQLSIIMVGKQAVNAVLEMMFPLFYKWLNTLKIRTGFSSNMSCKGRPQWVKDFKLVEWGPRSLFPEYLEMVLQYGFVTIFVAAFPLAPLFALLNNILEMRLDAQKLLTFYRRPVTQRVRDIGVWYRILDSIGKLSVVTNGFIIAFTSNFIPHLVYRIAESPDMSLRGYVNHSLSYFNTSHFTNLPKGPAVDICRYPDYRVPHTEPNRYELTSMYWHVLAARLAFVVVFENVVAFVIIMVKCLIPDIPKHLRAQVRREMYITNEIIIAQETARAQSAFSLLSPPISREVTLDVGRCPTTPQDWDVLINKSLTGSDLDLMMHSDDYIPKKQETGDDIKSPITV